MLGVSFDTEEENKAFAEKFDFPFQLLCDTDREVGLAYGACRPPDDGFADRVSYLVDVDGRVAQVWHKVNPKSHAQDVLDFLATQD